MPQVASSVSSGRPYRNWMTPRSMAMPTRPATRKADGNGDRQRVVEQPRREGADELLHHERGVGAQHHHLAVRHVDDAHDAEGDGEPDGREQQDGAEREAVPEVLHHAAIGRDTGRWRRWHRPPCAARWAADRRAGCRAVPRASWSLRSRMTAMASSLSTSLDDGCMRTIAARASSIAFLTRASVSLAKRRFERRQRVGIARLEHGLRRLEAPVRDRAPAGSGCRARPRWSGAGGC